MKFKIKYLSIILIIILSFGLIGCSSDSPYKTQFNTDFTQWKKIIEDNSKTMTDNQIVDIDAFQVKYFYREGDSYNENFQKEYISYIETKMTEALTSKNINFIDNLVNSSRLLAVNSVGNIEKTRIELYARSSILSPRELRDGFYSTEARIEPSIGMTELQVGNSTWGYSSDKNITKTANSNSAQWVYKDNKYIYFENGIVTAIQTH